METSKAIPAVLSRIDQAFKNVQESIASDRAMENRKSAVSDGIVYAVRKIIFMLTQNVACIASGLVHLILYIRESINKFSLYVLFKTVYVCPSLRKSYQHIWNLLGVN